MKPIKYLLGSTLILLGLASNGAAQANDASSFQLIDATSDTVVLDIESGQSINQSNIPSFHSFNFITTEALLSGSVSLELRGPNGIIATRNESASPYALYGDIAGDYAGNATPLAPGGYQLSANFNGTTRSVIFNVLDGTTEDPPISSFNFQLIDANTNTVAMDLSSGQSIEKNNIPSLYSFSFITSEELQSGSVSLELIGPNGVVATRNEITSPYTIFGDSGGNYAGNSTPLASGSYQFNANFNGTTRSVTFNISDGTTEDPPTEDPPTEDPPTEDPPTEDPPVSSFNFQLIDAALDTVVLNIAEGQTIAQNTIPSLYSFSFITSEELQSGSVSIELTGPNGVIATRNESESPYALYGDSGGDYAGNATPLAPGNYQFNAIINGSTRSVSFNISDDSTEDPPTEDPPTEDPPTEDPPTEDPPTEDPPTEDPPTEDPPTEDPPTEDPPTEDPPTEDPPTEDPTALRLFHKLTVDFTGPTVCESDDTTFTDYKLDVKFTSPVTNTEIWVPGYFAAGGNAIDSGATCGNVWRAHLRPEELGTYSYTAYLMQGQNAHVKFPGDFSGLSAYQNNTFNAGVSNGEIGPVVESNKTGRDLRHRGPVHKPSDSFYAIQADGFPFPILGAGSPEDFMGIADIDNNVGLPICEFNECAGYTQDSFTNYIAHVDDYDGTGAWDNGTRGKGVLGALNYMSELGATGLYIVTNGMLGGDSSDTWIYAHSQSEMLDTNGFRNNYWRHIDVSKADQWARVFEEANEKGIMPQLYLFENENRIDALNSAGDFIWENELRWALLTREFMARFGYLNGMGMNIGEEVGYSGQTNFRMCEAIKRLDPYTATETSHLCLAHTHNNANNIEQKYSVQERDDALDSLDGPAVQGNPGYQTSTCDWMFKNSPMVGKKYMCSVEEPNAASIPNLPAANLMLRGAAGWLYFDGGSDNNITDFRTHSINGALRRLGYIAQQVFMSNALPVAEMVPDFDNSVFSGIDLSVNGNDNADGVNNKGSGIYKAGEAYAAYLGQNVSVTLKNLPAGTYSVKWYDDKSQAAVQVDTDLVSSGGDQFLSAPGAYKILVVKKKK